MGKTFSVQMNTSPTTFEKISSSDKIMFL